MALHVFDLVTIWGAGDGIDGLLSLASRDVSWQKSNFNIPRSFARQSTSACFMHAGSSMYKVFNLKAKPYFPQFIFKFQIHYF